MKTIGAMLLIICAFFLLCLLWLVDDDAFKHNGMNS